MQSQSTRAKGVGSQNRNQNIINAFSYKTIIDLSQVNRLELTQTETLPSKLLINSKSPEQVLGC